MAPTLWAKTTDQHHRNATKSNPQVTAPAQTPIDPAARFHRTHDMLAQMLVERGPPGNERETHAIVDHCEPARCERDALAAPKGAMQWSTPSESAERKRTRLKSSH